MKANESAKMKSAMIAFSCLVAALVLTGCGALAPAVPDIPALQVTSEPAIEMPVAEAIRYA